MITHSHRFMYPPLPIRRFGAFAVGLALVASGLAIPVASAAPLTSVSWSVSNTQTSATAVTYAYEFTTSSQDTITTITMSVPTGTAGTPAVVRNYGIPAGTVALAGTTITYTVTAPLQTDLGTPIYLEFSGLTNTGTAGSYTSTVTATSGTVDSGTSQSNNFSSGGITTTIAVARSTVFSVNRNAFNLVLDPSVSTAATRTLELGVSSNARNGYSITCQTNQAPTGASTGLTLAPYQSGTSVAAAWTSGGTGKFGYALSVSNNGAAGSPAPGGTLSATNFAGFTTGGQSCGSATGGTGNPLGTNLSNCGVGLCASAAHAWHAVVKSAADYTTVPDSYTATLTFTVSPSY